MLLSARMHSNGLSCSYSNHLSIRALHPGTLCTNRTIFRSRPSRLESNGMDGKGRLRVTTRECRNRGRAHLFRMGRREGLIEKIRGHRLAYSTSHCRLMASEIESNWKRERSQLDQSDVGNSRIGLVMNLSGRGKGNRGTDLCC